MPLLIATVHTRIEIHSQCKYRTRMYILRPIPLSVFGNGWTFRLSFWNRTSYEYTHVSQRGEEKLDTFSSNILPSIYVASYVRGLLRMYTEKNSFRVSFASTSVNGEEKTPAFIIHCCCDITSRACSTHNPKLIYTTRRTKQKRRRKRKVKKKRDICWKPVTRF